MKEVIDPVCGMKVDQTSPHRHEHGVELYLFCSAHCLEKFKAGETAEAHADHEEAAQNGGTVIYTCPMHPEVRQDRPGNCPKCGVPLHCCKQCAHFEPSLRLQCAKPIRVRVSPKDKANDCEYFESRVTVARDATSPGSSPVVPGPAPTNPKDDRAAFDNLFNK